jgi:hypothetical protein
MNFVISSWRTFIMAVGEHEAIDEQRQTHQS